MDLNFRSSMSSAAEIDAMLSQVHEVARRLRSARNAYAPINRLPPEILSYIFQFLPNPEPGTYAPPAISEWVRVTHVCERWRDVAITCCTLWTQVNTVLAHPEWTAEVLRRSRNASLSLKAQVSRLSSGSRTIDSLKLALKQLHRTQELHMQVDRKAFKHLLHTALTAEQDAPRLRSLMLANMYPLNEVLNLPSTMFSKGAERLERLELDGCAITSWNMPLFFASPRLKTLRIASGQSSIPTLTQLLKILASMPALEELGLLGVVPFSSADSTSGSIPAIALPRLRKLTLYGGVAETASLLAHLKLPHRVTMSIHCRTPDNTAELSSLGGVLAPYFDKSGSNPAPSGLYISSHATRIRIHTSIGTPRRIPAWADFGEEGSLLLNINTDSIVDTAHTRALLIAMLHTFPLKRITSLAAEDDQILLDLNTYRELLRATPTITTLRVCQEAGIHIPDALTGYSDHEPDEDALKKNPPLLARHLEHLILETADFSWEAGEAKSTLLQRLQQTQFARCILNHPIEELSIVNCYEIAEPEIRTLCHLFTDVHWDGFHVCWSDAPDSADERDEDSGRRTQPWDVEEGTTLGWHS